MAKSAFPLTLNDRMSYLKHPVVALEPSFHAVRAVYRSLPYNTVEDITIPSELIGPYPAIYCFDTESNVQEILARYRAHALEHGASPEAVRLLSGWKPWTKKEEATLADKVTKKAAGAKKAAASEKPVGGGGKVATEGKRRGNPEALKKAREAAAERGPDVRKITLVNKENPYREDSNRAASFNALKGAKTVEDYKNAGGKVKYLSRWVSEGRIKLV